jgi:hypothetical protein
MIFHNVARDDEGRPVNFDGYRPGAPLVRVFEYDHPHPGQPERIAEAAFFLFNVDPGFMQPAEYEIGQRYRARQLRSLSVGDIVMVGQVALAVEPVGFRPVDGGQLNEVHEEHYGTVPLPKPHG